MPTMAEKGHSEASLNIWMGLYVPIKTPRPVQDALARALATAARDPAVAGALEKAGMHADYKDAAETQRLLDAESSTVGKVVERLGLQKQ